MNYGIVPKFESNTMVASIRSACLGSKFIAWRHAATALLLLFAIQMATAQTQPFALRSISFPLIGSNYFDDVPGWTSIPEVIQQLKAMGANDVKVTVSGGSYDSPLANLPNRSITLNPADDKILDFLKMLRAAGLQVTLQVFVNVNFDPNANLLDSVHAQPTDFKVWMAEHTLIMVRWARMAQQAGVERMIVIGDEVQGLAYGNSNTEAWLSMFAQIRAVYSGLLSSEIYIDGTTFGGGLDHVGLIDQRVHAALDILGIAWFPSGISQSESPTRAQLAAAWRNTVRGVDTIALLNGLRSRYNKPVWIADIAFHSATGDATGSGDIYDSMIPLVANETLQADEYDSLFAVLAAADMPWFLGVSCDSWNRWPLAYRLTHRFLNSEFGENIRGKLAETTISEWFNGQRGWGGMRARAQSQGTSHNLSLTGTLRVSPIDEGKVGNVYVAALLPNGSLLFLSNGIWSQVVNGLAPVHSGGALGDHSIPILAGLDVSGLSGTLILVGYGLDQNDLLTRRKYSVVYSVP